MILGKSIDEQLQNELNVSSNDRLIKLSTILKVKQIKDTPKKSDLDIYLQDYLKIYSLFLILIKI